MANNYDMTASPRKRAMVFFPVLIALAVIAGQYQMPGISADGVTYLQIARNILMGKGLGWQALWAPPLHSILIAGVSYVTGIGDLLRVVSIVSPLMFFLLVIAVYYLAISLFDQKTALVASIFTALSPHLLFIAFSPEGEITYTFFLTFSILLFMLTIIRGGYVFAIASGIAFALAWMARSEGFIVMALIFLCVIVAQGRGFYRSAAFKYCLLATLAFMLTASPYLVFLKRHYGAWVISPKSTYVLIWMKSRIYHDNDKGEINNEELWGLTPDGTKLRWQEPSGIGDLAAYLMSHPRKSFSVYLHNLAMEIPGRIPNNSGMERYPQLYPVYFAFAAILALFTSWGKMAAEKRGILLAPLLILLILPVFTEGWWKYLIPYFPIVTILAAMGFVRGGELLAGKVSTDRAKGVGAFLVVLATLLISARFFLAVHPIPFSEQALPPPPSAELAARRSLAEEARKAGEWGARRFGPGQNYMAQWSKIIYFLDGFWTAFPVAPLPEVLTYGKAHGVDFMVVELIDEQIDDNALAQMVPNTLLAGVYRSEQTPYVAAFYRLPK
ncbi:MAG: glycosyltransferase family 39 protein [Geobacter sp.]|nr:glycosyltransferase family 39 protein [Geobacter sp.]